MSSATNACHIRCSSNSFNDAGALIISTGSARTGTRTTNTGNANFIHKTQNSDKDVQDVNSKIYSQLLKDLALLVFDVTPTVSGAIYFR